MEDWEEQLYEVHEYSDEDRYLHEEGERESPLSQVSSEHEIDPSDWGRVGLGGRLGGGNTALVGKEKALRNPRDVSLDQMRGILNDNVYRNFPESIKDDAYNLVEKIPGKKMILYNIDILTAAALFTVFYQKKGGIDHQNIADFFKKTNNLSDINHFDFVRYIRNLRK